MYSSFLNPEEFIKHRSPGATSHQEEEEGSGPHLPLSLPLCHPPPLSPHMGFAFGWTLGFFHRGCQLPREREPQESWANVCGSLWVRRGLFILFFPPFFLLLFVPLFFLALWLTLMSEKITLICVSPVYYSPGRAAKTRPKRYGAVSYWLINFSLCVHTSPSVSLWVCVCVFGLCSWPMDKQNALREGVGLH